MFKHLKTWKYSPKRWRMTVSDATKPHVSTSICSCKIRCGKDKIRLGNLSALHRFIWIQQPCCFSNIFDEVHPLMRGVSALVSVVSEYKIRSSTLREVRSSIYVYIALLRRLSTIPKAMHFFKKPWHKTKRPPTSKHTSITDTADKQALRCTVPKAAWRRVAVEVELRAVSEVGKSLTVVLRRRRTRRCRCFMAWREKDTLPLWHVGSSKRKRDMESE